MAEHLFDKVNIDFQNVNIPKQMETDVTRNVRAYEAKIKALGGVDLGSCSESVTTVTSDSTSRTDSSTARRTVCESDRARLRPTKRFFCIGGGCATVAYTMESRRSCRRTRF